MENQRIDYMMGIGADATPALKAVEEAGKVIAKKIIPIRLKPDVKDYASELKKISKTIKNENGGKIGIVIDDTAYTKAIEFLETNAEKKGRDIATAFKNGITRGSLVGGDNATDLTSKTAISDIIKKYNPQSQGSKRQATINNILTNLLPKIQATTQAIQDNSFWSDNNLIKIIDLTREVQEFITLAQYAKKQSNWKLEIDKSELDGAQDTLNTLANSLGSRMTGKRGAEYRTSSLDFLKKSLNVQNYNLGSAFGQISNELNAMYAAGERVQDLYQTFVNTEGVDAQKQALIELLNVLRGVEQRYGSIKNNRASFGLDSEVYEGVTGIKRQLLAFDQQNYFGYDGNKNLIQFQGALSGFELGDLASIAKYEQAMRGLTSATGKQASATDKLKAAVNVYHTALNENDVIVQGQALGVFADALANVQKECEKTGKATKNLKIQATKTFNDMLSQVANSDLFGSQFADVQLVNKQGKSFITFANLVEKESVEAAQAVNTLNKTFNLSQKSQSIKPKQLSIASVQPVGSKGLSSFSAGGGGYSGSGTSSSEISDLEILKKKVEEVSNAVYRKTQAFEDEELTVKDVVIAEEKSLDILIGKIKEVVTALEPVTSAFAQLDGTKFNNIDLSKINVGKLNEKSIDKLIDLVPTLKTLNGLKIDETFVTKLQTITQGLSQLKSFSGFKAIDLEKLQLGKVGTDITGLPSGSEERLKQFGTAFRAFARGLKELAPQIKEFQGKRKASFDSIKLEPLVNSVAQLDTNKINLLYDLAVALDALVPSLKELSTINLNKKSQDALLNIGVGLEGLSKSLKDYNSDILILIQSLTQLADKAEGLKSLKVLIENPNKAKEASKVINSETAEGDASSKSVDKDKQRINDAIKKYKELTKKVNEYAKLKNKTFAGTLTSEENESLKKLTQEFKEAEKVAEGLKQEISGCEDELKQLSTAQANFKTKLGTAFPSTSEGKAVTKLRNSLTGFNDRLNGANDSDIPELTVYKSKLEELKNIIVEIETKTADGLINGDEDDIADIKRLRNEAKKLSEELNSSRFEIANPERVAKLNTDIDAYLKKNSALPTEMVSAFEALKGKIPSIASEMELDSVINDFNTLKRNATVLGATGLSFADKWKNKMRDLGAYLASFTSFHEILFRIRQGVEIVREYDDALTEMRKVSDQSRQGLREYQKQSFDIADSIGAVGKQIQQSTADFMRLGETFTEAQRSAQTTTVLKNVSEFENIEDATESMVAMSQAYGELEKSEILDKLNYAGNNFPIATDELARGMQRAAATLKTQGNDINEAIALVTAGNAIIQDAEQTAAGVRTIALRISGTKAAKDELAS